MNIHPIYAADIEHVNRIVDHYTELLKSDDLTDDDIANYNLVLTNAQTRLNTIEELTKRDQDN